MGNNRYKTLLKNTFFITLGGMLSKIVGFVMLPFYTAWMSTEEYGTIDLISVYATIMMSMTTMCLGESIFVFVKNSEEENRSKYFMSNAVFSLAAIVVLGVILFFLHCYTQHHNIHNTISDHTIFVYMYVLTGYLQLSSQQFACAINEIRVYSLTGVIMSLSTAILSFALIPTYHVEGFVWACVLSNIIGTVYTFIFSKSYVYFHLHSFSIAHLKEMLRYSIPIIPNSILGWLTIALNRPIMEKYIGLSAIGVFSISNKFPQLLQLAFNYVSTSWSISLFEEYNKKSFEKFFNQITKILFLMLFAISSGLILFGKQIIGLIADEKFFEAYRYLPMLSMAILFLCMAQHLGSLFAVNKKSKYYFYTTIYSTTTAVVLNFMLIPRWGILGASLSLFFSYFVYMIARLVVSTRYVRIHCYSFFVYLISVLLSCTAAVWFNIPMVYVFGGYLLAIGGFAYFQRLLCLKLVKNLKHYAHI